MNNKVKISFSLVLIIILISCSSVLAADLSGDILSQVNSGATAGGMGAAIDPQEIIASVVQVILALLGTIFLILMLLAGYWLITARGNEEKETKAIDTIRRAVIGLAIVVMAYGIVTLVTAGVERAVGTDPSVPENPYLRDKVLCENKGDQVACERLRTGDYLNIGTKGIEDVRTFEGGYWSELWNKYF